ncbi:Predicted amidohydrolase [Desulfacinum infernum DSM 9756]|jgi:predicted amidohydrolase|uniref:Predicted amidohydrolase n=1 Tax=Desulfacinum infernum DSM 9756 TaxID=1121391 RepID=A0A1M4Y9U6_9BACT|nr:carbon-nitrogen hydrolase family protein [Desulfacinum infernum]SHF02418.1 Predicted amidohydrolase [Desulfacinum infernum DSM 9756]
MADTVTVALAQVEGRPDPAENLEVARKQAQEAARRGATLVVFPEMFMALPGKDRPPAQLARESDKFLDGMAGLARRLGLTVVFGLWEPSPDPERAYNTVAALGPDGAVLSRYRKVHLFDALDVRESDTMVPGDAPPGVFSHGGVSVGLAICYDLRFPELFRHLADQGARLVLVPSAWYQGILKEDHWLTLLRARAIENTCYAAGCNLVGGAFCGRSAVFDPFGVPAASAGEGEDLILAEISARRVADVHRKLPALQHRRRDLFGVTP